MHYSPDIIGMIKSRRARGVGHVGCMEGKLEGIRLLGADWKIILKRISKK